MAVLGGVLTATQVVEAVRKHTGPEPVDERTRLEVLYVSLSEALYHAEVEGRTDRRA